MIRDLSKNKGQEKKVIEDPELFLAFLLATMLVMDF